MENLPIEILRSIFEHLPQRDLINLTLVCHQLRYVIEKSGLIKTMYIRGGEKDNPMNNDTLWAPKRNYSEATVKNFKLPAHLEAIESCGERLTTFELTHSELHIVHLVKILRASPNVKFLKFDCVELQNSF